jgi:2-oxoglutarate ferredoxin oxidoreductase subunit beta
MSLSISVLDATTVSLIAWWRKPLIFQDPGEDDRWPVGCSVFMYDYFNIDVLEAPHGTVASGVKRARKDRIVFTYQGDGDLAAIGISEGIHTANRGENITIIFANNGIYGMTGGQMAPTTLLGQKTSTSPYGRDFSYDGYPIRMAEMLATLEGCAFVARVAVNNPANLMKAKKAIRKPLNADRRDGFLSSPLACLLAACLGSESPGCRR